MIELEVGVIRVIIEELFFFCVFVKMGFWS